MKAGESVRDPGEPDACETHCVLGPSIVTFRGIRRHATCDSARCNSGTMLELRQRYCQLWAYRLRHDDYYRTTRFRQGTIIDGSTIGFIHPPRPRARDDRKNIHTSMSVCHVTARTYARGTSRRRDKYVVLNAWLSRGPRIYTLVRNALRRRRADRDYKITAMPLDR